MDLLDIGNCKGFQQTSSSPKYDSPDIVRERGKRGNSSGIKASFLDLKTRRSAPARPLPEGLYYCFHCLLLPHRNVQGKNLKQSRRAL